LFSDSTNIDVPERPGSERAVGQTLHRLVAEAPKCVVIAMFASNVQRLLLLGKIAQATGRKICLLGRSLGVHVEVARRIGRLDWPSNLVIGPEHLESQRRDKVLVLAGGTQGEGASAMRRLASQTHQHLRLEAGDTVIHSARVIPGNERGVHEMFCDLLRQGVRLHNRHTDPGVHTSGHAGRSEQTQMIEWLKPRAFVPVHGTLHHLREHAALARSLGVSETLVVENGTSVAVDEVRIERDRVVAHGKVNIAHGGEVLEAETAKRRTDLGRYGVVVVSLVLSADNRCVSGPRVEARGVPNLDEQPGACRSVEREIRTSLDQIGPVNLERVEGEVRRAARRAILESTGLRPVLVVHLLPER
ncbi:MAG TPA: ribonuclease J, partial [Polyangiaceae bacterium]|nr:ribonuclease J [Polyangiaceae bacterium]